MITLIHNNLVLSHHKRKLSCQAGCDGLASALYHVAAALPPSHRRDVSHTHTHTHAHTHRHRQRSHACPAGGLQLVSLFNLSKPDCVNPSIRSCILLLMHAFLHSLSYSFVPSFIHSFTHSFFDSFIFPLHPRVPFFHSFMHFPLRPLVCSFVHASNIRVPLGSGAHSPE